MKHNQQYKLNIYQKLYIFNKMDNLLYSLENRLYLNSLIEKKNVALITTISSTISSNKSSNNDNPSNDLDTKIKYLLIDNQYAKVHLWNPLNPFANKK
tara:strand:+ start:207 stop:500 length:294 start_codon:yes stop_codon:yes gene_type:complete